MAGKDGRNKQNLYPGINAPFNSELQTTNDRKNKKYAAFHHMYISALYEDLNGQLENYDGYRVEIVDGLQVEDETYIPDLYVERDPGEGRSPEEREIIPSILPGREPNYIERNPGAEEYPDRDRDGENPDENMREPYSPNQECYYPAIRVVDERDPEQPKVVAWFELLSPANKVGKGLQEYQVKRDDVVGAILESNEGSEYKGMSFIELDPVHHKPCVIPGVPVYQPHKNIVEEGAKPYYIAVSNENNQGTNVQLFGILDKIPEVKVELEEGPIRFDFQDSYNQVYSRMGGVDYSKPILSPNRYTHEDQARVLAQQRAILADPTQTLPPSVTRNDLNAAYQDISDNPRLLGGGRSPTRDIDDL